MKKIEEEQGYIGWDETMRFEEVWAKVEGLQDTAKLDLPGTLKVETKRKLSRKRPDQIKEIVEAAIDEVNHGSVAPLDELIRQRL